MYTYANTYTYIYNCMYMHANKYTYTYTSVDMYTVGELKIDWSFCRRNSFSICATNLVLVALDSPQLAVYQFSSS
jgi:hypothetical protein